MLNYYNTIFILLLVSTEIQNLKMLSYYTKYYTKLKNFFSTYFTNLIESKIDTKISKIIQLTPTIPIETIPTTNSLKIFINFKNITVDYLDLSFYTPQEIQNLINNKPYYKDILNFSHYVKSPSLQFVFQLRILFFYKVNLHLNISPSSISISTQRIKKFSKEYKTQLTKEHIPTKIGNKALKTNNILTINKQESYNNKKSNSPIFSSISIYFNSKTQTPKHPGDILINSQNFSQDASPPDNIYTIKCNYFTMQNTPFNNIYISNLSNNQISNLGHQQLYPKNVVHITFSKSDSHNEDTTNYYNFKLLESNFKFNFNKKTLNDMLFITKTIYNIEKSYVDIKTSYVNLRHYLNLYTQYYNSPYSIGQRTQLKRYLEFFESRENLFQRFLFWIHDGHWNILKPLIAMFIFILLDAAFCYKLGYIEIIKEILPIHFPFGDYLLLKINNCNPSSQTENLTDFCKNLVTKNNPWYQNLSNYFCNISFKLATIYFARLVIIAVKKRFFTNKIQNSTNTNPEPPENPKTTPTNENTTNEKDTSPQN